MGITRLQGGAPLFLSLLVALSPGNLGVRVLCWGRETQPASACSPGAGSGHYFSSVRLPSINASWVQVVQCLPQFGVRVSAAELENRLLTYMLMMLMSQTCIPEASHGRWWRGQKSSQAKTDCFASILSAKLQPTPFSVF